MAHRRLLDLRADDRERARLLPADAQRSIATRGTKQRFARLCRADRSDRLGCGVDRKTRRQQSLRGGPSPSPPLIPREPGLIRTERQILKCARGTGRLPAATRSACIARAVGRSARWRVLLGGEGTSMSGWRGRKHHLDRDLRLAARGVERDRLLGGGERRELRPERVRAAGRRLQREPAVGPARADGDHLPIHTDERYDDAWERYPGGGHRARHRARRW